ncbi:hypothetical protein GGS23DRAFT_565471 [Durotheca rogersii]|uniref:uncharacterized protein n=1 Tax=Durotheca rogersii TaxID=419775 RepID=UPI002220B25F|nr:uncharacterized protein GGS23DRAFT_565471 [Durotheca rogersii]KAI5863804.1 hypothetical protein GGS23DRAFT_565471 [Durotheca rogersii]
MRPRHQPPSTEQPSSSPSPSHYANKKRQDNLAMEDLRHAKEAVTIFTHHIDRLQPDSHRLYKGLEQHLSTAHARRHGSTGSDVSRKIFSKRGKGVGKSWVETPSGLLWSHISQTIEDVAADQLVDPTALKEFISTPEILDLGSDFVHHYRRHVTEKMNLVAEDLFFDLQSVKQGDASASRWTRAKSSTRAEWDLASHLARFVLGADDFRKRAEREDWNAWDRGFTANVCFYLSILSCFTDKDAERRAAQEAGALQRSSLSSSSKHSRHSGHSGGGST